MNSLERGLHCLMTLGKSAKPLTIKDLSLHTGIPTSSIYRILRPLEETNLIQRNADGERFLGLAIFELVASAHNIYGFDIVEISRPFMERISHITQETVLLTVLMGHDVLCIEEVASPKTIRLSPQRGKLQLPIEGCSSKVLLAYTSKEFQQDVIQKYTGHRRIDGSEVTVTKLLGELETIKTNGYAISVGEVDEGAAGLSVPILSGTGEIKAGLSILGPGYRFTNERMEEFKNLLQNIAHQISIRIDLSNQFIHEENNRKGG